MKVFLVELKDWQPYLSSVPDAALSAVDYALKDKYGQYDTVTKKIIIKIEIMEVENA